MTQMLYGTCSPSQPQNYAKSKVPVEATCDRRTRTDVERGLAEVVSGVWHLATFWYPDTEASQENRDRSQ